ncbi:MAG: META domain-containing protein [Thiobacillus sp.]|nr:META domain-containing protein [Thiobacillus sp.]
MFRAGLAAGVSVGVLLMLAGCASDAGGKPSAPAHAVTIKGALVYRERLALPPDSTAVVELRDTSSASVGVVAEQRVALAGRQVPIPFELVVDRAALPGGKTYSVRGAIEQAGQVTWLSAATVIDLQQDAIDLGLLNLQAVQGGEPVAVSWRCGDQLADTEEIGGKLRLTLGGTHYNMRQVEAASGAQYAALDDATTTFWSKGERARLTVKGKAWSGCVRADQVVAAFRAGGHEPDWHLEMGTRTLFTTADGTTRIDALTPVAETTASSRHYAVTPALQVTIANRLCVDTMSGMPRPNSVSVLLGGRELRGCGGDPASLLEGTEWRVEDIAGAGIVDGSRATLNFGADGQLAGSGSCNQYSGSYTLTGEDLRVSSKTAMTMMACVPELMQQESRMLQLLSQVQRFKISADGALILETGDGGTITARR